MIRKSVSVQPGEVHYGPKGDSMPYDIVSVTELPPRERKRKYNLDELDIGQAIIIPAGEKYTPSAIYSAARALGITVSIRKANQDAENGSYHVGDILVVRVSDKDDAA